MTGTAEPYGDLPLREFLDRTASKDPVPGGGSVSALAAAAAAALGAMVARLTIEQHTPKALVKAELSLAERQRACQDLITGDAEAYQGVIEALHMPKDTPDRKQARAAALQSALQHAAAVPLRTAETALAILGDLAAVAKAGKQTALSDVAVGALLAEAGLKGALLNVRINLDSLKDATVVETLTGQAAEILRAGRRISRRVQRLVDKRLWPPQP